MGIRDGEQAPLWVVTSDLPKSPGHPSFARLNALLDANDFDGFVEKTCRRFYAKVMGRPSLTPGRYVGVAPSEEDDDFDFEQTLLDIHLELADLNGEAAELAATIQQSFEDLAI